MPSKPTEEQRQTARKWLIAVDVPTIGRCLALAELLAEREQQVRLDEAKWWSGRIPGRLNTEEKERIAALERGEVSK